MESITMAQELLLLKPIDVKAVSTFIERCIAPSLRNKLMVRLRSLTLKSILKSTNPYLIKVGGSNTANEFIEREIEDSLRSSEVEFFADSLDKIATFICERARGGRKSRMNGAYLELKEGWPCWDLLSGSNEIYRDMLGTLGNVSQERVGKLYMLRARKINLLTGDFLRRFSSNGLIDRDKLIRYCFRLKGIEKALR
jgi:hypothetical protein